MKKILVLVILLFPLLAFSQDISDYLILNDIGGYKFRPKLTKRMYRNSGVLISAAHFDLDHDDIAYETRYILPEPLLGVEVKVTQHAGADSDRWLLHELDAEFRNYYGIPGKSYFVRKIDNQTTIAFGSGGWDYRWLSGYKVIVVEYTDLEMRKPEPSEVVKVYLAKHPSTLPPITAKIQRSQESIIGWIKDETERRLGLCDKCLFQLKEGKAEILETLEKVVKHMEVFLNYRERYHGVKAKDEKIILTKSLDAKDGTAIKNKLAEYKKWWVANKGKSIKLP